MVLDRFLADIKDLSEKGALILEPVNSSVITFCIELIAKHHIPVNDAIHLYTALINKELLELFVCSDESLLKCQNFPSVSQKPLVSDDAQDKVLTYD